MLVSGEIENVPLLDVLQVMSYSKQTGVLKVGGAEIQGALVFERGAIVCGESTSTRPLLARAALEREPRTHIALRRVGTLAALTELLGLRSGTFRFQGTKERLAELAGVSLAVFYDGGTLDTGELSFDGVEEVEVIELDVESEPALAAGGAESLIGALGEDIDSLIDSIIDDIGSSAKGAAPAREPPPTHIPLFSDLTTSEFIAVALLLVRRVAKVGEVIVREGDPGESMFIVSTGEVRATILRDGRQAPVATMRDGDFFGEMAVLSGEPRTATVTAVKSTELLELSREHLSEICARHPHVEAKIRLAYDERVSRSAPQRR